MNSVTPGRRDQRRVDRREAIIRAARECFLRDGYSAMSMSGLVRILSGSKTTLWGHFPTKEALFAAVLDDIGASFRTELDTLLTTESDLRGFLVGYCESFLRVLGRPETLAAVRMVIAEGGRLPHLGRIFHEQAVMPNMASLESFLHGHVAGGRLRPEDPHEMASLLIDLCAGTQTRLLLGVDIASIESNQAMSRRFADAFLKVYAVGP